MPYGSKQRTVTATPDGVVRSAFGATVAGSVSAACIYRLKAPKKVSVMTGKWELDQQCLSEAGHALIKETTYGKIYSTSLLNARKQFSDNLRGDESHAADGSVPVVVKRLGGGGRDVSHDDVKEFMQEVEAMKDLSHYNVLKLYGVVSHYDEDKVSMSMVLEFPARGNLKKVLDVCRNHAPAATSLIYDTAQSQDGPDALSVGQRVTMISDVASACAYLHSKSIVLRDLGAHTCQVSAGARIRVGDDGTARVLFADRYAALDGAPSQLRLPLRWMAPETLKDFRNWSSASDVWTWAVTAWEIATLGLDPYADVPTNSIARHVGRDGAKLSTVRLDLPEKVTQAISDALSHKEKQRPTAASLVKTLEKARKALGMADGGGSMSRDEYAMMTGGDGSATAGRNDVYEMPANQAVPASAALYDVPEAQRNTRDEKIAEVEMQNNDGRADGVSTAKNKKRGNAKKGKAAGKHADGGGDVSTFVKNDDVANPLTPKEAIDSIQSNKPSNFQFNVESDVHGHQGKGSQARADTTSTQGSQSTNSTSSTTGSTIGDPTASVAEYEYQESSGLRTTSSGPSMHGQAQYCEPEPIEGQGDAVYEVPEAFHPGQAPPPPRRESAPKVEPLPQDEPATDATYETPEPFSETYDVPSEYSESTYETPSAHGDVDYGVAALPPAEWNARKYDNQQPQKDVDLFDNAVPTQAATTTYGLPSSAASTNDDADVDSHALQHLMTQYGGDAEAQKDATAAPPSRAPMPTPAAATNAAEDPQPVALTIETLHGAELQAEPASEATTPTTKLEQYLEKYGCPPRLYVAKRFGRRSITAHLRDACKKGHYEVVDNLLKYPECDVSGARKGGSGKTALHIAADKGYRRIVNMLLERNANPFVRDMSGKIPLDYANARRFDKIVTILKTAMLNRGDQYTEQEQQSTVK